MGEIFPRGVECDGVLFETEKSGRRVLWVVEAKSNGAMAHIKGMPVRIERTRAFLEHLSRGDLPGTGTNNKRRGICSAWKVWPEVPDAIRGVFGACGFTDEMRDCAKKLEIACISLRDEAFVLEKWEDADVQTTIIAQAVVRGDVDDES